MVKDKIRKQHILKTITWRILATGTTVLLAWYISNDPLIGFKVGSLEFFIKMILYYFHERVWYRVNLGLFNRDLIK